MAETYDIYIGESADDLSLYASDISDLNISMPVDWLISSLLGYETSYYWRVDATNEYGTTTGDVWEFTTIAFDPPQSSWRLIPGGSGNGPNDGGVQGTDWEWTAKNYITTGIRRLVAAAADAIWYENI